MIDSYPKHQNILPQMVNKINEISQSDLRILRLSFTNIGFQLVKALLGNQYKLQKSIDSIKEQPKLKNESSEQLNKCLAMIKSQIKKLFEVCYLKRSVDPLEV